MFIDFGGLGKVLGGLGKVWGRFREGSGKVSGRRLREGFWEGLGKVSGRFREGLGKVSGRWDGLGKV